MARRLTSFSKFLITVLILAALFFLGRFILKGTQFGQDLLKKAEAENTSTTTGSSSSGNVLEDDGDVLDVQLVTWGGYAPGLYFNEGSEPTSRSRYFKDYGLKVRFHLNDDLNTALSSWIANEYDVLVQTADAFPLYTGSEGIEEYKPRAFMQVDWSRGGDVIVAKRGINSINDLKGKRIALATPSPSQTLLITALEAANLKLSDVILVRTSDPVAASLAFQGPDVDAAVTWSPFDIEATRTVPGSKALLSTQEQSHIIGDIMFAKEDYINNNRDKINAFYEGWMKGVSELFANKSNQDKAAKILGEFLKFPVEDAEGAMSVVRWASHGDNLNFFGLNPNYNGQSGGDIYNKMNQQFASLGEIEKVAPFWRNVISTGAIQSAVSKLVGDGHKAEKGIDFAPATESQKSAPPIASKPVSISFTSGQYTLTENAKTIIDIQFAETAKTFANARIRIEGNTDNVGGRDMNMRLSRQRATSVANYLRDQYEMDPDRFIIVGNGPDKPVSGCETNATDNCRSKNRRTDFELVTG